jgi:hypothetical protein
MTMSNTTSLSEPASAVATPVRPKDPKRSIHLEVARPYSVATELQSILASLGGLLAVCAVVWLALFALSQRFPYVMVGSAAVYNSKEFTIANSQLLDESKECRVLAFGSSKVLSGFVPSLFDHLLNCSSYNLGLPATEHFMPELEKLLARGERPSHILVTIPWTSPPDHRNSLFHFPDDDAAVLAHVFPFRTWVHDSFILLYRSPKFGGIRKTYLQAEQSIQNMNSQKGYYFIAGESHYPNNELPNDFRLDSDQPQKVEPRTVDTTLKSFRRLNDLAQQYNFQVLLVPTYRRPGEVAPVPEINSTEVDTLKPFDHFKVLGPDYYVLDRKYFSDILHLNPDGAQVYTSKLSHLVAQELQAK